VRATRVSSHGTARRPTSAMIATNAATFATVSATTPTTAPPEMPARAVPWLLTRVARTGSRELFTLAVLAVALGIAVGAATLFGVSVALGAFFAGVVISESDLSYQAGADALPLQDAFAVLFFVSVGMLFDPLVVVREPLRVLGAVLVVWVGSSDRSESSRSCSWRSASRSG
jgi:predicted Kef-type K+ transport protein